MYDELVKRLKNCATQAAPCLTCDMTDDGSCIETLMKQAADAIEELSRDLDSMNEANIALYGALPKWIPVTERLPESGVHVLLACKTWGGNKYVCDGFHTEKFSQPTEFYEDIDADYSEETDEYYFPEGWWEVIKNWDDYSCVAIEDTVTHWMPLPQPPKEE